MDELAQKIYNAFVQYVAEDICETDNPSEGDLDLADDWLAIHVFNDMGLGRTL